jgi:hypothetical protein
MTVNYIVTKIFAFLYRWLMLMIFVVTEKGESDMPRYIDADKLIEELQEELDYETSMYTDEQNKFFDSGLRCAIRDIKSQPTADVVPKSEEGTECPTCHGTGRIGTTDWLTKNISKKQLAEEKAKAIAEHEQYIKTEFASEIFADLKEKYTEYFFDGTKDIIVFRKNDLAELEKKYRGASNEHSKRDF